MNVEPVNQRSFFNLYIINMKFTTQKYNEKILSILTEEIYLNPNKSFISILRGLGILQHEISWRNSKETYESVIKKVSN